MLCRMHPHHQGSTSLMMQTCSLPVVLDENPSGGFDFLDTPSCAPFRRLFTPDNEVIMHMQVSLHQHLLCVGPHKGYCGMARALMLDTLHGFESLSFLRASSGRCASKTYTVSFEASCGMV